MSPTPRLSLEAHMQMRMTPYLRKLIDEWERLNGRPKAMAPDYLRATLTDESYALETRKFQIGDHLYMVSAIQHLAHKVESLSKSLEKRIIEFGIGDGDGLDWTVDAIKAGFTPIVFDVSQVALRHGEERLAMLFENERQTMRIRKTPELKHDDLKNFWPDSVRQILQFGEIEKHLTDPSGLDPHVTFAIKVFRVLQHMSPRRRNRTLKAMGKFLRYKGREVHIGHPDPEDNPGYPYSTSMPVPILELKRQTEKGAGCPVQFIGPTQDPKKLHDHLFFKQLYRFFGFEAAA